MNAPVKKRNIRDHDGVILDLLDDIVRVETQAKALVDRLDRISQRSTIKIVDVDGYVWSIALVALVALIIGIAAGCFFVRAWWL